MSILERINSNSTQGFSCTDSNSCSYSTSISKKPTYKLTKCIGFGGYGRVYEAIRSDNGIPVIIKLIHKSGIVNWSSKPYSITNNSGNHILSRNKSSFAISINGSSYLPFEIECLLRLRDTPGIIKIYDFFEESTCFVIVMEKLSRCMTLFDLTNGKPFLFSQTILKRVFTQLIKINLSMFAKGIVHRDIKPENILINLEDYSIKLIDFGSAANFRSRGDPFREFQGTLECMPPEWVLSGLYESETATIWSIGVTFYFSIFGRYPFRNKSNIVSGKFPLPYQNVPSEILQFLDSCFQMNPNKRFTLNQLLNSIWFRKTDKN
jgi:serine/threonine protein kinase